MKRYLKLFVVFYFLGIEFSCVLFGEADSSYDVAASKAYLTAYETMKSADYLREKGLEADAEDMYLEALKLYRRVAENYPNWQPELVAFRINYCRSFLTKKDVDSKKTREEEIILSTFATNPNKVIKGPWRIEATVKDDDELEDEDSFNNLGNDVVRESYDKDLKNEDILLEAHRYKRNEDYPNALLLYEAYLEKNWSIDALKGALFCAIILGEKDTISQLIMLCDSKGSSVVKDAELKYLYGVYWCMEQDFIKAKKILLEASSQDPTNPLIKIALGVAFAGCGMFNEAEAEMRKALSINSKIGDAYYNLAWIRMYTKGKSSFASHVDYKNALRYGSDPDPSLEGMLP